MSVACGTNDKLNPTQALWRGLGRDGRLGRHLSTSPEPLRRHRKRPTPSAYFHLARGTRVTLWQDGEPQGPPTAPPAPADGMDVTVHSKQEHENHTLTQLDPDHSTTMTSIPLQRRG
jgi:hypothetical protein